MSNILFITPNPVWGGAATANLAIAQMLQDNGHRVIVNDEYFKQDEYNRIKIDHTPIHQKRFSDRSLLNKLVIDNEINYIIWSPLAAIYFYQDIKHLKKLGIKQIAIVHSLSLAKDLKGRLIDFLVSLTLANMSTIVYVSQYTMDTWDKFRAIRKSKVQKVVVHNVVDLPFSQHSIHSNKPRIGFVGRLSEEKQPQIFCDLSTQSQYDFCVYGDGPQMAYLTSKYKNIQFNGLCNDVDKIYSDIDILVMTSRFENCPMVILEAQAFAVPCVAPNVGGIPELIENGVNGILYKGYKTTTILDAISEILSNYSRFSANSLSRSKNHTPLTAISQWNRILS